VLEDMANSTGHGAFAVIGNSRYGWYSYGEVVQSDSNLAHKKFVEAVVNGARLGQANQMSKIDLDFSDNTYRWIAFETNLLGCPFTDLLADPAADADFEADVTSGSAPLTVNFTDLSTATDITEWSWDLDGDGVEDSTDPNPTRSYLASGCYTVSLTITTASGETYTETKDCYIEVTVNEVSVDTTGQINIKNYLADRDMASFLMKNVTDIGTVADYAANSGNPFKLKFQFGDPAAEAPIYSFTAESSELDAAGNRLVYSDADGNMVRCKFNKEECVIKVRYVDLDKEALDALLTGTMTVSLELGGTMYTNTGIWNQIDSGSGTWTKYKKSN
jgi:PKD repeat protein